MSIGLLPDLQYSSHSSCLLKPRECTNSFASSNDLNTLYLSATLPVPSQSPIPFQSFLYTLLTFCGISSGFLSDLQYSLHSSVVFKPIECTNFFASRKGRYFLF